MLHVDSEGHRLPALAVLVPVGDNVADELGTIHPLGELGFDVVATLDADAEQVRLRRREASDRHQVFLGDQFRDLRTLDHGLEYAAEAAPVAPTWRGCQAEQHRIGVRLDDPPISFRRAVVTLIYDQQVGRRQLHLVGADGAHIEGVDRSDLHRLQRPRLDA
jgi:hypothetical protein